MKKLFTYLIPLLFAFIAVSQETDNNFYYKHMIGSLGQHELIADFIIKGNEVTGSAYSPAGDGDEYGLMGKLDEYGIAELEAYINEELAGTFSGALKENFSGYYRQRDNQYGKNFELRENYAGSVRFKGYTLSADSALLDSTGSPQASIDISILLPDNVDSNAFIRESVLQAFFGNNDLSHENNDSVLLKYADIYFNKYIEANIDIFDGGHAFNWEMITNASIVLNRYELLCYRADSYAYTGGAHGMGISRFLVFDTQANIRLQLRELLIEGYEQTLGELLEKEYREMRFMDEDEPLTEAGLFDNFIHPTENFLISDEGITFFYNPYELAPYAMGSISISLHKDEILDILQPDASVKRLGW